jgi:hypothetical protein
MEITIMKDSELIKLYEKYKRDSICSALHSQFLEVSSSLDQISVLAENNPEYLKMKEDAKLLKRKTVTASLARFAEVENKRKINIYASIACILSVSGGYFSFYQNYKQQLNNSKIKSELFALLNDQMEQSSQEMFDKIQNNLNKKIDESFAKTQKEEIPEPAPKLKHKRRR